jgi:phosphatidylglycerophosphate synthase
VSGSLVSPELRARVRGLAEPVARGLGRLGFTPNHLTFIGFGLAVVAAVAAASQAWLAAGLLVIVGGVFDLFDGTLARATGRASKLGAFYDSVFDRWGESLVFLGVAVGCVAAGFAVGAVLAGAAMASAFMVGYARAKSELLGFTPGTGMAGVGLAPREVRLVILTVGLVAVGLLDPASTRPALGATLGIIAVLATITTIQRILHVRAQAREG